MSQRALTEFEAAKEAMWRQTQPAFMARWDAVFEYLGRHEGDHAPAELKGRAILVWFEERIIKERSLVKWDEEDRTRVTPAQVKQIVGIADGFPEAGAVVEYGYCDEDDAMHLRYGQLMVQLTRGIEWDNERTTWLMDTAGALTIL